MRDPQRIDKFINELGTLWKDKVPDWRFGQLMYNFLSAKGDPFYWEEDEFFKKFKEYLEGLEY